eukprot:CAMPEP_0171724882 /NCGR_PEP_ID=MMETSP0991-20121206/24643_1 /TAXON_ID=483369 /ORGANISM="non described non described, Strain CCMP2098" /LENGTH=504 /DNA_ID=CAMNT_0012317875 /DNA_START=26 /DNA_END=1540 /DNA_ORIENTATION=+
MRVIETKAILAALAIFQVYALPVISSWSKYSQQLAEEKPAPRANDDPSMIWFTSKLDHYDRQISANWQQRSFQNSTFFNGSGPVFLCVGGEGPALDASVLISSVHCNDMVELAPKVGALMLAVEHRYYGESMPTGRELTTQKLRWLSSQQALGDLAGFHSQVVANYSLTETNKWVAFGGSYPGMMAGFFRLKFPHLVHAAVSSSSPWQAKLDMQVYQDLVGDSLAVASVGGSEACKNTVVDGHAAIGAMILTNEGRASLAKAFNFCDPDSALPTEAIAGEWAGSGVIEVPSQENDPSCTTPSCDIGSICATLLVPVEDFALDQNVERLAAVSSEQKKGHCLNGWSEESIFEAEKLVLMDVYSSARSWPYQTCTEFGFYQTCEIGSRCPFVQGYHNVSSSVAMCARMFGLDAAFVEEQIEFTNAFYGGDAPSASRILFPNGNVDPWHGLGVLAAPSSSEPVMMVDGASHHAWTHPASDPMLIAQPQLADAKAAIQQQILDWLSEE